MEKPKSRYGELLIAHHLITSEDLDKVLSRQKKEGGKLNKLLIDMKYLDEDTLLGFQAKQLNIPLLDLKTYNVKPEVVRKLPEKLSRQYQAVVLAENEADYLVGMVDPQDIIAEDEIRRYLQRSINLALVRESDWLFVLNSVYTRTDEISAYAKELSAEIAPHEGGHAIEANMQDAYDAPVTRLLQSVFHDAIQMRASDIHLEPEENLLRIRQRIDGVLHENVINEPGIAAALALRLKLMGSLKIAEKRMPQDGRFSIKVSHKSIDVRLSTMPVQNGESIVMRLLDQSSINLKMDQLGIPPAVLKTLYKLIKLSHGMVLVTGPTGSGKTSTLYSMLNELNSSQNKVITVEDPVEYRLPRINQVQVNTQIGLTFAQVLRAALRQDPDVLMVGEIRDKETATIALNAAMTGHFVLATMHTNDAISSAMRLLNMESESYAVAAGLRAVIAQRLLRRICQNCSAPYHPDPQEKAWFKKYLGENAEKMSLKAGKGCAQCYQTGYKGRIPTFELFEVDDEIADSLIKKDLTQFREAVRKKGFTTLAENAISLATQGITTIEEVLRVTANDNAASDVLSSESTQKGPEDYAGI